ncbi:MAG: HEAT repeat domain-containing protein [Actinomycetota bacterium]|nr:HEAT repeat domain-containing protein [Actinomycetota bacterium]MDI7252959.1 HEAT repeat domain-containing protein [Actinomycetota bacterium]
MNGRGEKALDILRRGWEFLGRLAREYRQHAEINKGSRTTLLSGLEAEGPRCVPGGEVGLTEDGRSDGELKGPAVSTSSAETGGGEESAPMTRSLRELMEDLRDASPRVRGEAAKELGKRGGPGVEGALEPLLEDADEGVRSTAVRALRDLGSEEAVRILREALKRGGWEKRTAAAEALRELGWRADHSEEGAVYRILSGDWDGVVELGRHAVPPLVALIRSCSDEVLRERAVRALGRIRDPSTFRVMAEAIQDIHPLVRKAAAWSLGQAGRRKAVEPLIAALKDPDDEVRKEVAEALLRIGTPALYPLVSALKEGDPEIKGRVAEVIGLFYQSPDMEPLVHAFVLSALKDGDTWSRARMAALLGEIGEAWAVKPLIEALYFFNVREAAGKALLKIGEPALGPLMDALKHHHIPVRKAAAELLGRMGDERAVSALQSALKDRDWEVREAARVALESIRRRDSGDDRSLTDRAGLDGRPD